MTHEQFKTVWLPLSPAFVGLASRLLGSESDARDAVQDLYVRLWNARDRLDGVESPQAYGLTMTRNICLDRLRERNAHRGESLEGIEGLTGGDNADRRMIGRQDAEMLRSAMRKMPPQQAELIRLRYFRELDYAEIATKTGLSPVNVRVTLMRARRTLKKLMRYE